MNENIDLTKILKDCPKGTKFYTSIWGKVTFIEIKKDQNCLYPICIDTNTSSICTNLTKDGRYLINRTGTECILFPSKDQRDWSKFTAPWYKKKKFNPKTLNPFDKILVRNSCIENWYAAFFSHIAYDLSEYDLDDCEEKLDFIICTTGSADFSYCIPFNDETKHLVGTTDEAPEYYRYWED